MDVLAILLCFGIPLGTLAFFVSSLVNYLIARKNKADPEEMKKRKLLLIISSAIAFLLVVTVVGTIALVVMAIAYM